MEEQEWSYSELEKEAIKDFKKSRVDMIRANWRFHEQERKLMMKDKINQVQRTISLLASMIDSGEQNSIQTRRDTLQALISLEEIKNGLNTKENELPPPRGHKEVCPHPANQVFLLNGWYRCEKCKGKWKSKIK